MKKKIIFSFILIFSTLSLNVRPNYELVSLKHSKKNVLPSQNIIILKKWFDAWELVNKKIYKINKNQTPVEFVFFDDIYVYSTSKITVPNGSSFNGPNFFNRKLNWKKEIHNGKIVLPNKQEIPIGIICFAGTLNEIGSESFFVMPLYNFWQNAGVDSKEISLEKLTTGVFLHEFSHTQQMRNFGKRISEIEAKYKFDFNFSDNIIQDYFKNDENYVSDFENEIMLFYESALSTDVTISKKLVMQGFKKYNIRHDLFFKEKYTHFKEIDDLFLSMEGFGQYTMYVWLIDKNGGNIDKKLAIKAVRRDGKNWSQEEGFSLFLILEKLSESKKWVESMVGLEILPITKIIGNILKN